MDHIESSYEKDMEANWAIMELEKEVQKARDRERARDALLTFLELKPDFKRFYELLKTVEKY